MTTEEEIRLLNNGMAEHRSLIRELFNRVKALEGMKPVQKEALDTFKDFLKKIMGFMEKL